MTAELNRDEILRRFTELLDSAWTEEAPPAGIDPEMLEAAADAEADRRSDAYSMWSAVTALTQEVKLQGRTFLDLKQALEAQTARMLDELRAAYAERERNLQREAERRCRREVLSALIDLHDRLARGLESSSAHQVETRNAPKPGWFQRVFSPPAPDSSATVDALFRGYELSVQRLDQTLDEFHAREIRCQGEKFDPRRMNAIESEESAAVPEGTVLAVYRSGYEWNGEVFRPAQVKVSRAPSPGNLK